MVWIQVLYWTAVAAIVHAYLVYPFLITKLARRRRASIDVLLPIHESQLPHVAILISAYNAEKGIRARIENLAHSDYPPHRMSIVVASDGSTDNSV